MQLSRYPARNADVQQVHLTFELTNQDSAGGKKTVLPDVTVSSQESH